MKQRVYEIIKGLGLEPDLEVKLTDKNRRADVLVGDNVFEIQLSKQSEAEYQQRSQDYWDMEKEVYWIVDDNHDKFDQPGIAYPVALIDNSPVELSKPCKLRIPYTNLSLFAGNTADLDEWITNVLNNGAWSTENRIYESVIFWRGEVRKAFFQYSGFIVEATDKHPLGLPPKEAFLSQIQKRYGTDFQSLSVENLKEILEELSYRAPRFFLAWLYPNHAQYLTGEFGKYLKLTWEGKRTSDYAEKVYTEQKKNKQTPNCSCPSQHYTIGASKRKNDVFVAHRFCQRCGSRSSECIAKRKFEPSVRRNAHEWVSSEVNYKKTDNQPWANT